MSKFSIGCIVVAAVFLLAVVIAGLGLVMSYNQMVGRSQEVDKQWAQVQNQYQRRVDLIPNLVNTVKGAANFEKTTLEAVTEARASVGKVQLDPNAAPTDKAKLDQFEAAQRGLSGALSRLLVVSERYPELRATAAFRDLQAQLEGTENRIAVERGRFNDAVRSFNTSIKSFPNVLVAGMFGFHDKPYFTAVPGSDTPPAVDFNAPGSSTPAPGSSTPGTPKQP